MPANTQEISAEVIKKIASAIDSLDSAIFATCLAQYKHDLSGKVSIVSVPELILKKRRSYIHDDINKSVDQASDSLLAAQNVAGSNERNLGILVDMLAMFLSNKFIDINTLTISGKTLLNIALENCDYQASNILLRRGADPTIRFNGISNIDVCLSNEWLDGVKLFIKYNYQLDAQECSEIFVTAAYFRDYGLIKTIIKTNGFLNNNNLFRHIRHLFELNSDDEEQPYNDSIAYLLSEVVGEKERAMYGDLYRYCIVPSSPNQILLKKLIELDVPITTNKNEETLYEKVLDFLANPQLAKSYAGVIEVLRPVYLAMPGINLLLLSLRKSCLSEFIHLIEINEEHFKAHGKRLLDYNVYNKLGKLLLILAYEHDRTNCNSKWTFLQALLDLGECVDLTKNGQFDASKSPGSTLLERAIADGEKSLVLELLARNADLTANDAKANRALHKAVLNKDITMIEKLIAVGAKSCVNAEGDTPLHLAMIAYRMACAKGDKSSNTLKSIIILLVTHFPEDITLANHAGKTPRDSLKEIKHNEIKVCFEKADAHAKKQTKAPVPTKSVVSQDKATPKLSNHPAAVFTKVDKNEPPVFRANKLRWLDAVNNAGFTDFDGIITIPYDTWGVTMTAIHPCLPLLRNVIQPAADANNYHGLYVVGSVALKIMLLGAEMSASDVDIQVVGLSLEEIQNAVIQHNKQLNNSEAENEKLKTLVAKFASMEAKLRKFDAEYTERSDSINQLSIYATKYLFENGLHVFFMPMKITVSTDPHAITELNVLLFTHQSLHHLLKNIQFYITDCETKSNYGNINFRRNHLNYQMQFQQLYNIYADLKYKIDELIKLIATNPISRNAVMEAKIALDKQKCICSQIQSELSSHPEYIHIKQVTGYSITVGFNPVNGVSFAEIDIVAAKTFHPDIVLKRDLTISRFMVDDQKKLILGNKTDFNDLINRLIRCENSFEKLGFISKIRALRLLNKLEVLGFRVDQALAEALKNQNTSFLAIKALNQGNRETIISLCKQLRKLVSECGVNKAIKLLHKYKLLEQVILPPNHCKELFENIKFPNKLSSDPNYQASYDQYQQGIGRLLKLLSDRKYDNLPSFVSENKEAILAILFAVDNNDQSDVSRMLATRFIATLLMAGMPLKQLYDEAKPSAIAIKKM